MADIISGHCGFTVPGSGSMDTNGCVEYVQFHINFLPRNKDVIVAYSLSVNVFGAKMGDGTIINLSNPTVVDKTRSCVTLQFKLASKYPSDSPCELVYRTNDAYINIKEII